jgi:two-component system, NarL family, nitrate/nitrite response regulator NarL
MVDQRHNQIRVVIADDHPLFRDGLARTIRQDRRLLLVGEAEDSGSAMAAIRRFSPEVAVLDAALDVLRILGAAAQDGLSTRIALLAEEVRPDRAFEAVAAGAKGYLSKRVAGEVVCDAVRRIAAGEAVLCQEAQTVVTSEIQIRHRSDRRLLSRREHEVLVLMADGRSYPEIGQRLHLAPSTVKTYAGRIYERLGVQDRLGAVVEAMRRGILD